MAKQQAGTYTKQEQTAIIQEVDEAVQKLIAGFMRKHTGVVISSNLGFTFPSAPVTVQHSGNTHKLDAAKIAPPPQATE